MLQLQTYYAPFVDITKTHFNIIQRPFYLTCVLRKHNSQKLVTFNIFQTMFIY
jgi:hypothetical protein